MKVGFITTIEVFGPNNAGSIQYSKRNLGLIKQVFGEENIYICVITRETDRAQIPSLNTTFIHTKRDNKLCMIMYALGGRLGFGKKTENKVLEFISQHDIKVVFSDRSLTGFLPKRIPSSIKQILYMMNIERDTYKLDLIRNMQNLLLVLPSMLNESCAVRNADVIINLNTRDAALLEMYYSRNADLILPITFDDYYTKIYDNSDSCSQGALRLLFVGTHHPTIEYEIAMFVDNVMPYVNAELIVVGRSFEQSAGRLNRKNVNVIGSVDDLSEYYNSAHAIISPISYGGGMKVKIAEAIMYGKPVFATNEALEGYEIDKLKNIFRCNSAKEFVEAINKYAENLPHLTFDEEIRSLFLEKYHTPKYVEVLQELFREKGIITEEI